MRQITEHIYCMDADAETDQPFIFLIQGQRFSLLADTGNSPENYRKFLRELNEAGLKEPDLAVLTHWHWDHTFGACAAECPVEAISEGDSKFEINADLCIECGACADTCPVGAPAQA